ncbi:uncharacterized protein LOC134819752 isoform X1 [Bolinopsis microptera]|uniref:uncharacterized protein LOC134819752 isoform X1 n=1 Tax=Bolinopsis microptera TaxID=2820187 RepID=UPI003079C27D
MTLVGYLSLVITCSLLGPATSRPRRHSKRILSPHEIKEFAKPPSAVQPDDQEEIKPPKTKISGGKIKFQTRPNYISDKRPDDNQTTEEENGHYQIPYKIGETKEGSQHIVPVTHRPVQRVESTTSEYYTKSTRAISTTPPWHQQFIDLLDPQKPEHSLKNNNIGGHDDMEIWAELSDLSAYTGTAISEQATSTTPDYSKCQCAFIEPDKLYSILVDADNNGYDSIPYYRRLDLLQMGLYSNEQAKRCFHYCRHRTVTVSQTYSSKNMPTYGPIRRIDIEIVTGSVDPDAMSMIRARQHCYQTLKARNVTVNDRDLCYDNYKPTHDSPQPSTKPKGLNVWTCCKTIQPRGYY